MTDMLVGATQASEPAQWWRCAVLGHSWYAPGHTLAVRNIWVCRRCGEEALR